MQITLYHVNDAANVIGKTMLIPLNIDIKLKRDFNIVAPELHLLIDRVELAKYNYLHMPDFGRFYFIDNVVNTSNRIYRLDCSCDVLETYKAEIKAGRGDYSRDISDGDYSPVEAESSVFDFVEYKSDVEFERGSTILITTIEVQNA